MRHEFEAPFLDDWLQETEVTPPDPQEGARRVATRLPHTRQAGRWLPFRLFRPKAQTPAAIDTIEYQPSPIPAGNGHTPTVIGRTQTMFSPVKAITAAALVFALGGLFLVAQPFDQQGGGVPGASIVAQTDAVRVTATQECSWGYPDGIQTGTCTITASDPRLTGTATITQREIVKATEGDDNDLETYDEVLQGPEGTWTGRHFVVFDRSSAYTAYPLVVVTGDGAYEGWTYVAAGAASPPDGNGDFVGVLYQGPPPAAWEMPTMQGR